MFNKQILIYTLKDGVSQRSARRQSESAHESVCYDSLSVFQISLHTCLIHFCRGVSRYMTVLDCNDTRCHHLGGVIHHMICVLTQTLYRYL